MKKLLTSVLALTAIAGVNAQTYTDITPSKFDFSKYSTGPITNFWDTFQQVNHAVAGGATDEKGVITMAQDANFEDGYAYFYFTQPTDPSAYTQIVNVEGVGNVLQFGDAGMGAGFGGCYFVPACDPTEGMLRATLVFRKTEGTNSSNTASMNIGARDIAADGPDLAAVSYSDMAAATEAGKWYKATVEYQSLYALRVNFAQLIWGDNIQIAQVKFEAMTEVPADYEAVKTVVNGTFEELVDVNVDPDPEPDPEPDPDPDPIPDPEPDPDPVFGELTYTDITPAKFDFSKYEVGAIDNFWDTFQQVNHAVAGSATEEKGVITMAQDANFEDGYAYFYFNQAIDPNANTQIVNVPGAGNVLQFGDTGIGAGFGGCYLVPVCDQPEDYMRATVVCRVIDGVNNSHSGPSLNIGVRNIAAEGPETVLSQTYPELTANAAAGNWYKVVIEYKPVYALRINFGQLIWGDNIQIAQVKFETMSDVPAEYEPVQTVTPGTLVELGIDNATSAIGSVIGNNATINIMGNNVTFGGNAVIYNTNGAKVAQGTSAQLRPGLYIAYVNGKGVKFIVK